MRFLITIEETLTNMNGWITLIYKSLNHNHSKTKHKLVSEYIMGYTVFLQLVFL